MSMVYLNTSPKFVAMMMKLQIEWVTLDKEHILNCCKISINVWEILYE